MVSKAIPLSKANHILGILDSCNSLIGQLEWKKALKKSRPFGNLDKIQKNSSFFRDPFLMIMWHDHIIGILDSSNPLMKRKEYKIKRIKDHFQESKIEKKKNLGQLQSFHRRKRCIDFLAGTLSCMIAWSRTRRWCHLKLSRGGCKRWNI